MENIDWLEEAVNGDFSGLRCVIALINKNADDYLLIDCPGQIELYTYLPAMQVITRNLQSWGG